MNMNSLLSVALQMTEGAVIHYKKRKWLQSCKALLQMAMISRL
ncbi:hypothetical protein [Piscirickettsia salmonis]